MPSLEVKGKITFIGEVETFNTSKGEMKKKVVAVTETEGTYPKTTAIELMGDKAELQFNMGQEITVQCNVSSREYNGRWYHSISAWKIDCDSANYPSAGSFTPPPAPQTVKTEVPTADNSSDDLPF